MRHGFEALGLKRLVALIHLEHEASIRTAMKAGLRFEKEAEMEGVNCSVIAIAHSNHTLSDI